MEIALRIVGIITPVLLIAAIGYAYGRLRKPDMSALNQLNVDLLTPLLVFSSMASKDFNLVHHLPLIGCGVLIMLGSGVFGWLVARLAGYNPHAFLPPVVFTNTSNMGFPLTLFAFGPDMLPAAVALFIVFSLGHFTVGIRMFDPKARLGGILRGPMLGAMLGGLLMSAFGLNLPPWLGISTRMLGESAIPLGLFSLGIGFASFHIKSWRIGLVGALLCPIAGLLVAWPLTRIVPLSESMQGVLLLYGALPPAVLNYVLAERYRQEPALVAAIVVCGNIASLFFVPLALYLALPGR
ncbi:MAG: AEC family transporter [Propionivibrio sp.]